VNTTPLVFYGLTGPHELDILELMVVVARWANVE